MQRYPKILTEAPIGRHFCQIHDDAGTLTKSVDAYARAGLVAGHSVILITEPTRRTALEGSMREAGIDVAACLHRDQLVWFDTEALRHEVLAGDVPDFAKLERLFSDALARTAAAGYRHPRVYGELVNVLWREGAAETAVTLEDYWNELTLRYRFALFCGYELDGLDEQSYAGPLGDIARCHSDILDTEHDARLQDAIDRASAEVLGLPISSALYYFGNNQYEAERRLPPARRTVLWLRRNMPSAVGKVLARARVHYAIA